jgi:hypothetical protein
MPRKIALPIARIALQRLRSAARRDGKSALDQPIK